MPERESLQLDEVRAGLRMVNPPSPAQLQQERQHLVELESAKPLTRTLGYFKLIGPGYLQSAMTLGGGTAAASLFAGAIFGYQLLWVAPLAMALGIIMLAAISHQTLSTGLRPFEAMKKYAGAPLAYGWAVGALLSSLIWHFPQYALASAVLVDMADVLGAGSPSNLWMGLLVLVWAIALSTLYGTSARTIKVYESILKYMVWGVVLCFGLVVVRTGISNWGELGRGFFAFQIPEEKNGVAGATLVLSGLAAAVGVNMVFLYPYSLLARGWGREHRRLARFDLGMGMFVPYVLATSLMVIATANTVHMDGAFEGKGLRPEEAAQSLAEVVGPTFGRVIFNLGVLAMALSSITLQMLTTGFVCVELFGWPVGSLKYRLATLLPTPGFLGCIFWAKIAVWVAVPTNILCGFLLPAAYFGFIRLQRRKEYLGADQPTGAKGGLWLLGMVITTLVLVTFLGWYAITKTGDWLS
jgi:Mn2+/Fe2+ NRAMP family transporter